MIAFTPQRNCKRETNR